MNDSINYFDLFGLYEIPEGFFEYNRKRFDPLTFSKAPREAQKYEIDRFNKKYPFGWNNRPFLEFGQSLKEGMGIDPNTLGERFPSYIGIEGYILGGGGLSLVSCFDEKDNLHYYLYIKWGGGAALGVSGSMGPVLGMNRQKCKADRYEGWFFESGGAVGFIGAGLDIGLKDSDIKIPLINEPMPKLEFSGVAEAGAGPTKGGLSVKAGFFDITNYLGNILLLVAVSIVCIEK